MIDFIFANEPAVRLGFFLTVLVGVAVWETIAPRRDRSLSRWIRWPNNFALMAFNTAFLRLLVPLAAVGLAIEMEVSGWGLFNNIPLPTWAKIVLSLLILDLVIYVQHVVFHAVPALWRLHRVHHTDQDLDVTSGARFHPLEILISMIIKLVAIVALGPPAIAVLAFEVVLNATAMFNHGNIRLPYGMDRLLRFFMVTPDMHRVHHSVIPEETNSNYGFNIPWWDRLFGTYRQQPSEGHLGMTIGIETFRTSRDQWLDAMLIQPFRRGNSAHETTEARNTE